MAFGKTLVLLLAAVAVAAAQHDPSTDPFYHPTGRPATNSLAGASSQRSPGFPQISKLLPLVQSDTLSTASLLAASTKLVVAATWDFGNPATAPAGLFRALAQSPPATTGATGLPPSTNQQGRKLLQTTNVTSTCATFNSDLGSNLVAAAEQACAITASISPNCTCKGLPATGGQGRKLMASPSRSLLQLLPFVGTQQFFGECKEDFYTDFADCNYVFDAASAGLRANLLTGEFGNTFLSCTLFYDDGAFVTSDTCFTTDPTAPTVVRLNALSIEYAKNPSTTAQQTGTQPGTRISPETFLAANYRTATGGLITLAFQPQQAFGIYYGTDHQLYPGQ